MQDLGLRQLIELSIPMEVEKFDPTQSKVTISLKVTDEHPWKAADRLKQVRQLQ